MSLTVDATARRGGFTLELRCALPAGCTAALVGPNGAGKSTAVELLAGLLPASRGEVVLDGRVLERAPDVRVSPQARGLGVVFQGLALFPSLSALENVAYGLEARGVSRGHARAEALRWLERLEIGELATRRPGELSGGQAQRVALARAMIGRPPLLLLDEPMSALDAEARAAARALLGGWLTEAPGIKLIVTHSLADACAVADRLIVLEAGRVIADGPVAALLAAPPPFLAAMQREE
jgi:ABC-type sulfate/molybdate transport systems ATPase subunit